MAWQLLNRVYTIGTIDGDQDITPGAAVTGFRDFTLLSGGNTTYVVGVQGSKWAFMIVSKVGAILRPSTYIDGSNGLGSTVTFDAGTITVFSDLGGSKLVYEDGSGVAQNAESVLRTFSPETLVALKTNPIPSSGKTVVYLRGILADDQKGAFYVWDPSETATGDDFNYVVSSLSATGRWVRQKPILEVASVSVDGDAYANSVYSVSDELRRKRASGIVKKVAEGENFHQGEFITFAQWRAIASTQWKANDTFVFRGMTAENDLGGARLTFKWDASSTNTDALGVTHLRPDDISGSNAGRAVLVEPAAMPKFSDSDATPSMATARFHRCADTAPAAITALDDMVDLQPHWIFPGAQAQVFAHSSSLICPGAANFTLSPTDSPIMVVSDNGVVSIISGGVSAANLISAASGKGASLVGVEDAADVLLATTVEGAVTELRRSVFEATGSGGTTVDIAKRLKTKENALCFYGGAIVDLDDYSIAVDTPTGGSTRFTFAFTLAAGVKVKIFA